MSSGASSEIAQRREKLIDLLRAYADDTETLADRILAVVDQIERDTRERCAQLYERLIADHCTDFREIAERIRGKE